MLLKWNFSNKLEEWNIVRDIVSNLELISQEIRHLRKMKQ